MFMVLSSGQSHCVSLPSYNLLDECTTVHKWSPTYGPSRLASIKNLKFYSTQPKS